MNERSRFEQLAEWRGRVDIGIINLTDQVKIFNKVLVDNVKDLHKKITVGTEKVEDNCKERRDEILKYVDKEDNVIKEDIDNLSVKVGKQGDKIRLLEIKLTSIVAIAGVIIIVVNIAIRLL